MTAIIYPRSAISAANINGSVHGCASFVGVCRSYDARQDKMFTCKVEIMLKTLKLGHN
jgi:hypothetical protein